MYCVNTMARKLSFIEPTPKVRALFQHIFALIIIIVVHVYSKTSISINKYNERAESSLIDYSYNFSINFIALQYKLILQLYCN